MNVINDQATADCAATNQHRGLMPNRLWFFFWLFLVVTAAVGTLRMVAAEAMKGSNREDVECQPISLLMEFFDSVMPPVLPAGWSSTTWVTSESGAPTPPADTLPNAAFVDDPATISDKELLSPILVSVCDAGAVEVSFRNNFNFQDGFDGGVLEVSYDHGLTFQDVLAAGGTFVSGGYNGTVNSCCGNPLAGRQAWTGNSGGFMDTALANLPSGCVVDIILRWRMGSDSSVSGEGWRIDNVAITQCFTPWMRRVRPTPRPRPTPR